ncbi:MAG: hypothetical protein RJB66_518 [Pseudomonadota bacterium]|jgi:cell division protease FtsH
MKRWGIVILVILFLYGANLYFFSSRVFNTIAYSEFLDSVKLGSVESVVIVGDRIQGTFKQSSGREAPNFISVVPKDAKFLDELSAHGVTIRAESAEGFWQVFLSWFFPILLLLIFWKFISGRLGPAPTGLLSVTKSLAKTSMETEIKTTFNDVAGIDEAREELSEIVNFLQDPKRYTRLGGRAPKGVLLVGAPGTGKTLLARAVAGEARVPFYSINGSEFVEMFVGLGAARVRDLFEKARKAAPCILFIDEIDALGKSRAFGGYGSGASDEKEQTLNQLLAEMDGFDSAEGVIMLAATNRPEILDPALLRAGRFDRQILLSLPDQVGRFQILVVHAKKVKIDPKLDLKKIAALTSGFSGADLANLVNEAAIVATRRNAESVFEQDFSAAIERIVAGLEKKTRLISPQEKRRVAYHEIGHATVALALRVPERVQKISVIPRGFSALGYTLQRPMEDRYLLDEKELMNKIAVLLGGRSSELMVFTSVSTGAADDLAKASDIARSMVVQFGMSDSLGLETFELRRAPYLDPSNDYLSPRISQGTAREIDLEVKAILEKAMVVANNVIRENEEFIEEAARELLARETLDEEIINHLWNAHHRESSLKIEGLNA